MRESVIVLRFIAVCFIAIMLHGCSMESLNSYRLNATLRADKMVNPNYKNKATPVVLTIYQLKKPDVFNQASFFELYDNAPKVLGNDYLGDEQTYLKPGEKMTKNILVNREAKYIGVVAAFRNMQGAVWRKVIEFDPFLGFMTASVKLSRTNVVLSQ